MKSVLAVILISLAISIPSFASAKVEMTPYESVFAQRDIGKIMVKVTPVKGNPLAQDFTLVNPELIFIDAKEGEWIPFSETELFLGSNVAEEGLGFGPFAKLGMDVVKSRVSRKTVRMVYNNEIYYGSARQFLHGFLLDASHGHGVWEAK